METAMGYWTTDPPSVPGFYALRHDCDERHTDVAWFDGAGNARLAVDQRVGRWSELSNAAYGWLRWSEPIAEPPRA